MGDLAEAKVALEEENAALRMQVKDLSARLNDLQGIKPDQCAVVKIYAMSGARVETLEDVSLSLTGQELKEKIRGTSYMTGRKTTNFRLLPCPDGSASVEDGSGELRDGQILKDLRRESAEEQNEPCILNFQLVLCNFTTCSAEVAPLVALIRATDDSTELEEISAMSSQASDLQGRVKMQLAPSIKQLRCTREDYTKVESRYSALESHRQQQEEIQQVSDEVSRLSRLQDTIISLVSHRTEHLLPSDCHYLIAALL